MVREHSGWYFRGFKDYGEQVLKKLDSVVAADSNLKKAPVNYEGVRHLKLLKLVYSTCSPEPWENLGVADLGFGSNNNFDGLPFDHFMYLDNANRRFAQQVKASLNCKICTCTVILRPYF